MIIKIKNKDTLIIHLSNLKLIDDKVKKKVEAKK